MSGEERRVLARGTIRVDARRARSKLREHLLVDLASYSLEVVRAGLSLGATRLSVRWDADDVVLAFDGTPISPDRLARLLDFALAEPSDARARALRTLALGVNAALGSGAGRVDVLSVSAGKAWRARFTPELVDDVDETPEAEPAPVPAEAFGDGNVIHVRKSLGLDVLKRAFAGGTPREVMLLAENTHLAPLSIVVNGTALSPSRRIPALLRVPVLLPGAKSAWVEILPPGSPTYTELCENGVRLLSAAWVPLLGLEPSSEAAVPARLVVDASELPTNASRSALREDSSLARDLEAASQRAFSVALEALKSAGLGLGPPPVGIELLAAEPTALEDALGAVAHVALLAARADRPMADEVRALLDVPLLHGAAGQRLAVGSFVRARFTYVWREPTPLPAHLAPWLRDVVVLAGRRAEKVLDGIELVDAKDLVARAEGGAARRGRLMAHPASEPSVPRSSRELLRDRFSFDVGALAGLAGEVALLWPSESTQSTLRLFVEGRLLEVIPLDATFCPLMFDAAIAWPSVLRPRFDYDGVERDERLNQAVLAVVRCAIGCASRLAQRLPRLAESEQGPVQALLRDAITAWSLVPERLGYGANERKLRDDHVALSRAKIFPTTEPNRIASLADIDNAVRKTGMLCTSRGPTGRAVDGRPVLLASSELVSRIALAVGRPIEVVPYERGLDEDGSLGSLDRRREIVARVVEEERARQSLPSRGPLMWLDLPETVAAVCPAVDSRVVEAHLGVVLRAADRAASKVPLLAVFDDARTYPTASWDGVGWCAPRQVAALSGKLAEKMVAALEGDAESLAELGGVIDPSSDRSVTSFLLDAATNIGHQLRRGSKNRSKQRLAELARRIEALPLVTSLNAEGIPQLTSVAEIVARHGDAPPLLREPPGFATLDWHPLLARDDHEWGTLFDRFPDARRAEGELPVRRTMAELEERRHGLMASPERELTDLSPMAPSGEINHYLPADEGAPDWDVVVALPRSDLPPEAPRLRVSYRRHPFVVANEHELGLPLAAALDTKSAKDLQEWWALSPVELERIRSRVAEAGTALAVRLVERATGANNAGLLLADLRALALVNRLNALGVALPIEARLRSNDFLWPTIQHKEAPLSHLFRSDGKLWYATDSYPEWRRRAGSSSDLDDPVLYVPNGATRDAMLALMSSFGCELVDVSDAAAALQARRGGGAQGGPILVGMPPHPALRALLWELGFTLGDGAMELVPGDRSNVIVQLLDGSRAAIAPEPAIPVRVVLRVDSMDASSLVGRLEPELDHAAERLLLRACARLDEVPAFIREVARAFITRQLAAGSPVNEELTHADVFADGSGHWHNLGELSVQKRWHFTTLAPPFPSLTAPVLLLTAEEARGLGKLVELVKVDRAIERQRAGQARRTAPQLAHIGLSAELRAACLATTDLGTLLGEVGLLLPSNVEQRQITLSVERRRLCDFDDGPGWPVVAWVEDSSVEPDRWFEAPLKSSELDRIRSLVRKRATALMQRTFAPPMTALASRSLEDVVLGAFRVSGCLWLDSAFPARPSVRMRTPSDPFPVARQLILDRTPFPGSHELPIEGDLVVCAAHPTTDAALSVELLVGLTPLLNELAVDTAKALVAEARQTGRASPALDDHATSLALLGLDVPAPPVVSVEGEVIDLDRIREEIARRGAIWLSDGRGFVEGEFPSGAPSFVLPASSSPLTRVLALRTPPGTLRTLGGVVPSTHPLGSTTSAIDDPGRAPDLGELPRARTPRSVWAELGNTLTRLLGNDEAGDLPDLPVAPLARLLDELRLAGNPVRSLRARDQRRWLDYDKGERTLDLSARVPALTTLLQRAQSDPAVLRVLAAAAVSEVNRALVEVTDAEERRALLCLLADV